MKIEYYDSDYALLYDYRVNPFVVIYRISKPFG